MSKMTLLPRSSNGVSCWQVMAVVAMLISLVSPVHAQTADATAILKKMSDYVTAQKTLSLTVDTDIEVITSDLQKIQFASSGVIQLSRPDKVDRKSTRLN